MNIFNTFRTSASALTAQRMRLDTIANNVANVETTRTDEGGAFKKQNVVFSSRASENRLPRFGPMQQVIKNAGGFGRIPDLTLPSFVKHRPQMFNQSVASGGVEVVDVKADAEPGARMYNPGHPDADAQGYVTFPNVNLVTEMTDMLSATRAYEANVTVMNSAKQMAVKALEIGRG
ncbi:MAG: flagellar basal body rod protein FlgC [Chloroflexi bacterium]|nr:flagellar basal body rod protein FlgC [Chloroflexota bacterium]MDA1216882.1 flagellar basal body rod protein FlgC [Chloroflexota bacterium]MQC24356.1 flagellar basal body rod protein FlgC [Chloroflexota bacterium]MQC27216.1 flagellar basal body rod protein FlgC [Chloroflexota bacterium]